MKVLVLGMPRTGTSSLKRALEILDISPVYHGLTAFMDNPDHCRLWYDGQIAKFEGGSGIKLGREYFDQMLGKYEALSATPAVGFAKELSDAYPEAKVILTLRDVDTWHKSVSSTIYHDTFSFQAYLGSFISLIFLSPSRWLRLTAVKLFEHHLGHDFPNEGRDKFREHYDEVRRTIAPERLLEFHVKEGWKPLCEFLELPEPKVPFPKVNETADFRRQTRKIVHREVIRMLSIMAILLPIILALTSRSTVYRAVRAVDTFPISLGRASG